MLASLQSIADIHFASATSSPESTAVPLSVAIGETGMHLSVAACLGSLFGGLSKKYQPGTVPSTSDLGCLGLWTGSTYMQRYGDSESF